VRPPEPDDAASHHSGTMSSVTSKWHWKAMLHAAVAAEQHDAAVVGCVSRKAVALVGAEDLRLHAALLEAADEEAAALGRVVLKDRHGSHGWGALGRAGCGGAINPGAGGQDGVHSRGLENLHGLDVRLPAMRTFSGKGRVGHHLQPRQRPRPERPGRPVLAVAGAPGSPSWPDAGRARRRAGAGAGDRCDDDDTVEGSTGVPFARLIARGDRDVGVHAWAFNRYTSAQRHGLSSMPKRHSQGITHGP